MMWLLVQRADCWHGRKTQRFRRLAVTLQELEGHLAVVLDVVGEVLRERAGRRKQKPFRSPEVSWVGQSLLRLRGTLGYGWISQAAARRSLRPHRRSFQVLSLLQPGRRSRP